jgi:hypothetical protein
MKSFSIYATAALTFVLAMACTLVVNWSRYVTLSVPEFIGSLLGVSLGLWAMSGIALFFSAPENKLRNWSLALLCLAALSWYGKPTPAPVPERQGEWKTTSGGNRYRLVE